jgi:hypothetical protein
MSNALRPKAEVSLDQHDRYTLEVKYRVPVVGDREKVLGKITHQSPPGHGTKNQQR